MLTEQLYDINNDKQPYVAILTPKDAQPDERYGA